VAPDIEACSSSLKLIILSLGLICKEIARKG
jgi:hypothetical protein